MGFFDFFKNLFGKNKCKISPEQLDISITTDKMLINGNSLDLHCNVSALSALLGKPRKFMGSAGNINYIWDTLGVYCYANDSDKVYCMAVRTVLNDEPMSFEPQSVFKGRLSINGESWEQVMYNGEDMDIAKERTIDNLSMFAEYADFEIGDSNGFKGAYACLEIKFS